MILRSARFALSIVLLAACAWRSYAMDPGRKLSQYVRETWGADRGLTGDVESITQTPDGYLWIGTSAGLFRFDGSSFTPVADQSASPVPLLNVLGLLVGNRGNLIVRLPERNLLRYVDGSFENTLYPLRPRELAITAMCRANDGGLLVAGIVNGVMRYRSGQFESIAPSSSLPPSPVIAMTESADGKIWLGTREAGVFYLDRNRAVAASGELPSKTINALLADGRDLWIATDSGLALWDGSRITTEGVPPELRRTRVLALLKDRNSNLWVGAGSGLFRVNTHGTSKLSNSANAAVDTLFEDAEGDLWAGGPQGLERWRDGRFTTYGTPEGLPSDSNGPIYVDPDGRIWFAPLSGGLDWLDHGETKQVTIAGLDRDVVYSIAGTHDDIWVGRQQGGLTHLISQNGELKAETFTRVQGLAQNSVSSVYRSRDGSGWAGTLSGGLSRLQAGKFTTYSKDSGLASNSVASMLETSDGTMWFATANGLRAFAHAQWRGYTTKEGLPSDDLNCLLQDSKGVLWIGTAAGLAFLDRGVVATPRSGPEALRDPVFGLAEDAHGGLWIATSNHIIRVDRDKLRLGILEDGDLREYLTDDGLRSSGGVRRDRSVITDASGRIWFSMTNGLAVVDPSKLTNGSFLTAVHLQTISADNRSLDPHASIRIPRPPRRITFTYSGVSLWEPDRVRYRYRLDGYDSGWSEPTSGREAAYTNLGPGNYLFRVVARNPEGAWNSDETAIGFAVLPLFWQTWWFRAAVVVAAALLLLVLYRLKVRQLDERLNLRF
ncbi:MAG TPA: two-component regulator propeller domain-containing protein, partial [Bryobacteraceae bacterium]|nr:two-component regulator propeller domain-containing protein [Bryobacteraceae bacterium]